MWVFARPWRQIQRHSITNMIVAIILYEVLYISLCLCSKLNYQSQTWMTESLLFPRGRSSSSTVSPVFSILNLDTRINIHVSQLFIGGGAGKVHFCLFSLLCPEEEREREGPRGGWSFGVRIECAEQSERVAIVSACERARASVCVCVFFKGRRWECCEWEDKVSVLLLLVSITVTLLTHQRTAGFCLFLPNPFISKTTPPHPHPTPPPQAWRGLSSLE